MLLVKHEFGIIYGVIVGISSAFEFSNFLFFTILAVSLVFIEYLIGPGLVAKAMKVNWVSVKEEPELHRMVAEMAQAAGIRKPRVGIARIPIPNAFAFGRTRRDARVCVTEGIMRLLNKDELKAVLGHEIAHVKHRDMALTKLEEVTNAHSPASPGKRKRELWKVPKRFLPLTSQKTCLAPRAGFEPAT